MIKHVKRLIKRLIQNLPYIRRLRAENETLRSELAKMRFKPGHFYSPVPSIDEVKNDADRIFFDSVDSLAAIDLNETGQLKTLHALKQFYTEIPFEAERSDRYRYWFKNDFYSYADGVTLFCMMRYLHPQRIIEVGSGFSSALMLDVNDQFFNGQIKFDFIDPFPQRLERLLKLNDRTNHKIYATRVQDVPISTFDSLSERDILFIDSSHVSRVGSDVNWLLFEVLPRLKSGVYVHFHDIFYPFEYPKSWVYRGVAWNEAYFLRAFLQYNTAFKIEFFVSYLLKRHHYALLDAIPLALKSETLEMAFDDAPGANIWLRKQCASSTDGCTPGM